MTYTDAIAHKENVTGHTISIANKDHVFLVVPSNSEDFRRYTVDYFTKYKEKTFYDDTAKEYSSDEDFTVTNFMMMRD
jgi:hypothetical protein